MARHRDLKRREGEFNQSPTPKPSLRLSGVIPPLLHTPLYRSQNNLHTASLQNKRWKMQGS